MSLFKKASPTSDRLKIYIYGKSGTGKTTTALSFPSPVVIDAERGTDHYGGKFDFDVLYTSDPVKVVAAIDELLRDPQVYKSLVVDPMTVIYDSILKNKEIYLREKNGNSRYELQPLDYKSIKAEVRSLMNKLLSLDMNVIVTARSSDIYAKGKFMELIGEKAEGHKDLPYMFDVVIGITVDDEGKRWAKVDKDRLAILPPVFEFNYDAFVEHIGMESLSRKASVEAQRENINKVNERNTEVVIDGEKIKTAGIKAKQILELGEALSDVEPDKLKEVLMEHYEVESVYDLNEKQGTAFLKAVTGS